MSRASVAPPGLLCNIVTSVAAVTVRQSRASHPVITPTILTRTASVQEVATAKTDAMEVKGADAMAVDQSVRNGRLILGVCMQLATLPLATHTSVFTARHRSSS